ncbi:SRPBCC family protein [Micromonospora sp. B11E3]|uniref:SRPBCC family protein n=1 Tax=Micromonospora sp. B11E3 TaxID=3153562 RepID=UPI00325F2097
MIEIVTQVDLAHPSDRVWHALTDPGLLARWFTDVDVVAGASGRLLLHTVGMPGFDATVDAQVTELRAPELLVLRCVEVDRRTLLTCTVTPITEGCRLALRESLEDGDWPDEDRGRRQDSYEQALTGRLPAILDWLAFQEVDLRRGDADATAVLPVVTGDGGRAAGRRRLALVAALAGVLLVAGLLAWTMLPAEPEPAAGPVPAASPTATADPAAATSRAPRGTAARPTATPSASSASPSRTPTTAPSRGTPAPTPSAVPPLTARYTNVSTRLLRYTGAVVVDNPAGVAQDWTVVVTLAPGSTLADVSGAEWRQDGETVTFTGPPLPAGRSRTFEFEVRDAAPRTKAPESCTVDGNPCDGL